MDRADQICVVGLWHLGSVLSACWAEVGHRVVGVDASPAVVAGLSRGSAPLFEPGLDALIQQTLNRGRLSFATELTLAVPSADFIFIAFDTPVDSADRLDLTLLEATVYRLAPHLKAGAIVVVSSQVPVGTCSRWRAEIRRRSGQPGVDLAYSPENLRLGDAIKCYLHPDRIVLGAETDTVRERVRLLFAPMKAPVLTMSLASAEMTKHALNSFLATSISFVNEIADVCEQTGADILDVVGALKADPRVGPNAFLSPGFGFAGGTLARDIQVLREVARDGRFETPALDGVLKVNDGRPQLVLRRLTERHGSVAGLDIGVLGLTYKAGTSTLRRSVALEIIRTLVQAGATVRAFDPKADLAELKGPKGFEPVDSAYEAARGASALVILTEWPEFKVLDFERLRLLMKTPLILDGKNLLADLHLGERGFDYMGVGR